MSYSVSNDVEVITDGGRRRQWSYDEKLRMVEESLAVGKESGIAAARKRTPIIEKIEIVVKEKRG